MPTEEVIVLANSRKPGGRCVAGISLSTGGWVRPVSDRASSGALSPRDCAVEGRMVEVLDIVRFGYVRNLGDPAQPENVLIDHSDWELARSLAESEAYDSLRSHLVAGPALLGGTERGVPDAVARNGMDASLALVEPDAITFRSEENPFRPGARRARAVFELASRWYDLGITDRVVGPAIMKEDDGSYAAADLGFPQHPHTVLTVSLTEPLGETRWKLVAAVQFLP